MKNLRNQSIFTFLFLLVFVPLGAESLPPPSPAGGNYLVLDGVDDHAILDFETFGLLMPKDTDEFTFEAWIYPTTLPKKIDAIILSQQVRLYFRKLDFDLDGDFRLIGGAHLARAKGHAEMASGFLKFSSNQWNHVAFQGGKGKRTTIIVNDLTRISGGEIGITLADDISHAEHPQDFTIGGFGKNIRSGIHGDHFWGHFSGYIDEVRISKGMRYNTAKRGFTPRKRFKNDAKTVALWHFDEPKGTREFSDASGNAYHLMGKNSAEIGGDFAAVEAEGKLATIWGRLKQ